MSITASDLVAVETAASKSDLWRPPALFLHDWSNGLTLRTSWTTALSGLHSAGEVRSALTPKPSRSIDVTWLAMAQSEQVLLRSVLQRLTMARTPVPLFCDATTLTAAATAGATTLSCDTTRRRFFAGGRVALWPATSRNVATTFDLGVITAVWDAGISLASAIGHDYAMGSLVAPVMEADLVGEVAADYVTDTMLRVQLTFRETVGPMTLDPLAAAGSVPDGTPVYTQYSPSYFQLPVFTLPAEWGQGAGGGNTGGAERLHETTQVGLVNYTEVHGERFKATQTTQVLALDRAGAWAAGSFFDSRGGRQKSFMAVNLTSDFTPVLTPVEGASTLTLSATGPAIDWAWRTHLALELADGSLVIVAVDPATAVVRTGGTVNTDAVTLLAALPALSGAVVRIAAAFVARFGSDELVETWHTDWAVSVSLPQVEAVREGTVEAYFYAAPTGGTRRRPFPIGSAGAGGGGGNYHDYGLITPVILNPVDGGSSPIIEYWASGADLPAGDYRVSWVSGALSYIADANLWGVHYHSGSENWGYLCWPNGFSAPGAVGPFATEAQSLAVSAAMNTLFHHSGGAPIGIGLIDNVYEDNQAGASGRPTWRLERIG